MKKKISFEQISKFLNSWKHTQDKDQKRILKRTVDRFHLILGEVTSFQVTVSYYVGVLSFFTKVMLIAHLPPTLMVLWIMRTHFLWIILISVLIFFMGVSNLQLFFLNFSIFISFGRFYSDILFQHPFPLVMVCFSWVIHFYEELILLIPPAQSNGPEEKKRKIQRREMKLQQSIHVLNSTFTINWEFQLGSYAYPEQQ